MMKYQQDVRDIRSIISLRKKEGNMQLLNNILKYSTYIIINSTHLLFCSKSKKLMGGGRSFTVEMPIFIRHDNVLT